MAEQAKVTVQWKKNEYKFLEPTASYLGLCMAYV
jgi:hypothetical protein